MTRGSRIGSVVRDAATHPALLSGLSIIERDASTVQVGVDPPRCIIVRDAPPGTAELLRKLNGERSLDELTRLAAERHHIPVTSWDRLLAELRDAGFFYGGRPRRRPSSDRPVDGTPADNAAVGSRRDAVAVVVGTGRVASSIATLIAAAGVGHVHLDPHRAVRVTDVAPAGLGSDQVAELRVSHGLSAQRDPGTSAWSPRRLRSAALAAMERPRTADRDQFAAMIRRVSPETSVHAPSGYVPPDIVVLATDGPADQVQVQELVSNRIPHLGVRTTERRGVVGPLVLPGRSSCLHCHDLHRRDRDPGWPQVLLALQNAAPVPPIVLATTVAATAADQILQYLDGRRTPDTVDGTLEHSAGDWTVRRRSWQRHPSCFCQTA